MHSGQPSTPTALYLILTTFPAIYAYQLSPTLNIASSPGRDGRGGICPGKFAKIVIITQSKWKRKVRVIDDVNNNIIVMVISIEYRSVAETYLSALSIDIRHRWGKKEAFFPKNRPKNCTHTRFPERGPTGSTAATLCFAQIAAKCCPTFPMPPPPPHPSLIPYRLNSFRTRFFQFCSVCILHQKE